LIKNETEKSHPYRLLVLALAALLCLTILTVTVAQFNIGPLKIVSALTIASVKATIVLLLFMRIGKTGKAVPIAFVATIVILAIFIGFIFFDIAYR
jgi:cytochrome c oxidase subunit 4